MQQVIIKEKKKLMENILLCINMMVLSVQDIMYKSLNVIILVILTITAVIYTAFNFNFSLPEIIAGICFVGALFGVSITFKCIGIGDVIVTFIVILIKGTVFAVPYFLTPLFSSPHFFCCTYSTIFCTKKRPNCFHK